MVIIGGLGPGGLDSWDPLIPKGLGYLGVVWDSNPKPPTPKPPIGELSRLSNFQLGQRSRLSRFVGEFISSHL